VFLFGFLFSKKNESFVFFKVNHFPGSFQIGRKDRLWRNLSHMQAVHSRREFDFVPQTFVLPADFLLFKRVFDEVADTKESKWIIKPVCLFLFQ
jgi:tubulin polyglutamylase TTLL4